MASIFNAPFTVCVSNIAKSYRTTCHKIGTPILLFEGGKSQSSNKNIVTQGVEGVMRILNHLGMLASNIEVPKKKTPTIVINSSKWIRAQKSGLLHLKIPCNKYVEKGEFLATITDPYGTMRLKVLAPNKGYIINVNQAPIVYQGDAIFHISTKSNTLEQVLQENIKQRPKKYLDNTINP